MKDLPFAKPKRKITRKGLVRRLDKAVSVYVIKRDKYCCCCGTTNNLTAGHVFSRVAYSTRWDLKNVFAQCLSCNLKHEYDPYPMFDFYVKKFGKKKLDALHIKYKQVSKLKDYDLALMLAGIEGL